MKRNWIISLMLTAILALSACQPAPAMTEDPAAAPVTEPAEAQSLPEPEIVQEESAGVTLMTAFNEELGTFLVGEGGMTLYMFTQDEPGRSNCDEGCLQAWPPLLAGQMIELGEGVNPALIGEGEMLDGRKIVTYNDMPLYYWVGDVQPGDTTGQGFSNVWYVVAPDGSVVGLDTLPVTSGPAADAVVVNTSSHPSLGQILVDGSGRTLYMFTRDEPGKSNCDAGCMQAWPPLLAAGDVVAGDGVDSALLGTAELPDGTRVVTYNQMPLYYWAGDSRPGDANGQNVNGVWFAVSPQGKPAGVSTEPDSGSDGYYYPDY